MHAAAAALMQEALLLHRRGALAEAADRYAAVLRDEPDHAEALYCLAQILCQQGRLAEGADVARQALAVDRRQGRVHNLLGMALGELGRPAEALASFDEAIVLEPHLAEPYANRGDVLLDLGRYAEAVLSYDQANARVPDVAENWCNRGMALHALGQYDKAVSSYDRAVTVNSRLVNAHYGRGNALFQLGDYENAIASFERAIALQPDFVDALNNLGSAQTKCGRHQAALATLGQALAQDANHIGALYNRAIASKALHRYEDALDDCDHALRNQPGHVDILNMRGVLLSSLGRHQEALGAYDKVLATVPTHTDALCNRAKSLNALDRHDDALRATSDVLAINSDHADALFTRGVTFEKMARYEDAIICHERVLVLEPSHRYALGALTICYLLVCDWEKVAAIQAQLGARLKAGTSIISPFNLFGLPLSAEDIFNWTMHYVRHEVPVVPRQAHDNARASDDKIRIAYLSGDFRRHPVSYLIAELFERHDRSHFEVHGISFGPDDRSDIRARIVRSVDQFHDVRPHSDGDVAQRVADLGIDIAIDLGGHTDGARPGILARRPAPIQVNYLGYAGTMGVDVIDYVIGDKHVLPFDQQRYFSEKIVHLPDCYLVNDSKKNITAGAVSRLDAGLPESGFVFCCFNNSYKISRDMFDVWMRLLARVEHGVLWLSQMNPRATANLRDAAAARGIEPARLIFAPKVPRMADHLARQQLADLFLDTLPYNAHTTASDALWAGLPVLTCAGHTFAGRVATSLLHAIDLPDLVTTDLDMYEALAFELATDHARLENLRHRLRQNRSTAPLFDTDRFRSHIEAAYVTMWQTWRRGERPRSFCVDPIARVVRSAD